VILTVILAISLTGCVPDSLGDYKKAAEKTDRIKKGHTSGEFVTEMVFNTGGMTEEQIKELNYFKNMKGSFDVVYDDEAGKGIFRNYLNLGGLGFDFELFIDGKEAFMKLPVIGKYMRLAELQAPVQQGEELELVSADTLEAISEKWLGMLKKEDIFQGKNIVLTTPDGEVKTREYTIRLKDEQIKSLAVYALDMLSGDEKLKEKFEEYFKKNVERLKDCSVEKLLSDMKENIALYTVEDFSYTAYVDIDGYIVNEMIRLSLKTGSDEPAAVTGVNYSLDIKNWDINREQQFEFPELTESNTLDTGRMEESMPFMLEDLFKNKD
ncbi:MAG TPA: hypothetical protein VN580_02925, partial [Clostridia bacterium]|nr:hypothetical protein [Clostridia bacterium]